MTNILSLEDITMADLPQVGGKNASLGEMISRLTDAGLRVPGGFATTADAYREFLNAGGLARRIQDLLADLDVADVAALARAGGTIRGWIEDQPLPQKLESDIRAAFGELVAADPDGERATWAVRSSARELSFVLPALTFSVLMGSSVIAASLFMVVRGDSSGLAPLVAVSGVVMLSLWAAVAWIRQGRRAPLATG